MHQHPHAEDEGRKNPSSPVGVERHPRAHHNDLHPRNYRTLTPLPLSKSDVCDLVAVASKTLGEVATPAFGAAQRMRKQAVVDDADSHPDCRFWQPEPRPQPRRRSPRIERRKEVKK